MSRIETFHKKIIEEVANFSAQSGHPAELYEPQKYMLTLGGKRMRPLLVLIGCDLFEGKIDTAISAAIAMELFHNFTLVHDDIMDNAPLRRNQKSRSEERRVGKECRL